MAFEKGKEAEERPLEKRFGFTCTTGILCFTCKKRLLCSHGLRGNIDLVLDFVTDFWPQKQGFKHWICKSIIQILLYIEVGWKLIASFCNWLESISAAQGAFSWPASGWKAGTGYMHSCWSKLHRGQVSRMILRRRLRSKPRRKIRQW